VKGARLLEHMFLDQCVSDRESWRSNLRNHRYAIHPRSD